jgi:hypothetical protein
VKRALPFDADQHRHRGDVAGLGAASCVAMSSLRSASVLFVLRFTALWRELCGG